METAGRKRRWGERAMRVWVATSIAASVIVVGVRLVDGPVSGAWAGALVFVWGAPLLWILGTFARDWLVFCVWLVAWPLARPFPRARASRFIRDPGHWRGTDI